MNSDGCASRRVLKGGERGENTQPKGVVGKWVVIHLYSTSISDHLQNVSADHADKESPGTMADAEEELGGQEKTK